MCNDDGDLSKLVSSAPPSASFGTEPSFKISTEHFEADVLPTLSAADTLVLLVLLDADGNRPMDSAAAAVAGVHEGVVQSENRILAAAAAKGVRLASVVISAAPEGGSVSHTSPAGVEEAGIDAVDIATQIRVQLPSLSLSSDGSSDEGTSEGYVSAPPVLAEFATKLILNAVSTGAHVLKGCVYHNRMINLNVSNFKLFERSVAVVESIAGVPEAEARDCLLCAIYCRSPVGAAPVDGEHTTLRRARGLPIPASIPEHVSVASGQKKLVPLALLLAMRRRGGTDDLDSDVGLEKMVKLVARAREDLRREPVLRLLLATALSESHPAAL
jgi:hypothetical protein